MMDWLIAGLLELRAATAHFVELHLQAAADHMERSVEEASEQERNREPERETEQEAEQASEESADLANEFAYAGFGAYPVRVMERVVHTQLPEAQPLRSSDASGSQMDMLAGTDSGLTGLLDELGSQAASRGFQGTTIVPHRQVTEGSVLDFFEISIQPGTGFIERFLLYIPPPSGAPQPMLVLFHKFGCTHWDTWFNTTYLQEARARGWFMLTPLGASNKSFSSLEAQANREAVLDWTLGTFADIDTQRLYGVGFSMGGGSVLNFAARHLDPAQYVFAAVANHTGGVDLNHTYFSDPPARFIFDFWFGDSTSGSADPWQMARSSVIHFDPNTLEVLPDMDLARNLVSTPLRSYRASDDAIPYLSVQNDALDEHFSSLDPVNYGYEVIDFSGHDWSMVSESEVCDFFAGQSLELPLSGRLLADRNATYFQFGIEQDAEGAFTNFHYAFDSSSNQLTFDETSNLVRATVDSVALGMDTTAEVLVELEAADETADALVLRFWPTTPAQVLRDGVPNVDWIYDSTAQELTLLESGRGRHVWTIQP